VSVDLIPNWLFFGLQWALAYRRYSMDYVDDEAIAEKARAGLWRGAFEKPWEWRRRKRWARKSMQDHERFSSLGYRPPAPETILPNVDVPAYARQWLRPAHQLKPRQTL